MKKITLLLTLVAAAMTGYAQQQVITETTVEGDETYVTHYLYDAQGRNVVELADNVSMSVYTYNELNQVVKKVFTDFVSPNYNRTYTYVYNEAGLVASEEEFIGERSVGVSTYTYDDHGNRTSIINSRSGMPIPMKNFYDDGGHLIRYEVWSPMGGTEPISVIVYTYDNDLLVQQEAYSHGNLITRTTYTYDDAGLLVKQVTTVPVISDEEEGEEPDQEPEMTVMNTTTFAYADIDAAFAPYNVSAVNGDGNTIVVSWEGTANSVVVDGKFYTVCGNTFTTPVLVDGTYVVYVANNGNAVTTEALDVVDNTKVGVSDVRLNGDITAAITVEENRDGEMVDVTTYNIPVAWTLPEGAHPVSYRIYYNDIYYVDVEDGTLRSYVIPARNTTAWSMTAGVYTLDFVIRVIAIYETGEMEPVNTLSLDTEAILALGMASATVDDVAPTQVYTLDGIRLPSRDNLRPGTYVFRRGNVVRKVQTR